MEFYLGHHNIPEFKNLDKAQRTEVWAATAGRRFRDPFLFIALIIIFISVGVFYSLGNFLIPWSYGGVLGGAIGAGLGNFVVFGILTPRARPHLAAEIKSRGW